MFSAHPEIVIMGIGCFIAGGALGMIHVITNDIVEKFIAKVNSLKTINVGLVAEIERLRGENTAVTEKLHAANEANGATTQAILAKFDEITTQDPQRDYDANADLLKENSRLRVKCEMLEKELAHFRASATPSRLARMDTSFPAYHTAENSDDDGI
jgi:ABC-type proline/glycine betaine transport system ATPase subunit